MNPPTGNKPRPIWAVRLGDVTLALLRNRYALRRTARRAGDQRLAQRLRRFARRRQAAVTELERMSPDLDGTVDDTSSSAVPSLRNEAVRAFETSALAGAIASNRRLRVAIERALESDPPARIRIRLESLRQDADREAGVLTTRFTELTPGEPGSAAT